MVSTLSSIGSWLRGIVASRGRAARTVLTALAVTVLVGGVGAFQAVPTAEAAYTAGPCSCVVYLQRLGAIPGGIGSAKDAGPVLERNGFRRNVLGSGGVMVFQPGAFGAFGDGHIARVVGYSTSVRNGQTVYTVTVNHANWSGGTRLSSPSTNCTNVTRRDYSGTAAEFRTKGVAFYKK